MQTNSQRIRAGASALVIALMIRSSFAQGTASASVKFGKAVSLTPNFGTWPTGDYSVVREPSPITGGRIWSRTGHGRVSGDELNKVANSHSFSAHTRSLANGEYSEQKEYLTFTGGQCKIEADNTWCLSQAAAGMSGDERYGWGLGNTTLLASVQIKQTRGRLVDLPSFGMVFASPDKACRLETHTEGNASAEAWVEISLIGNIRDINDPKARIEDLKPIVLAQKQIRGNESWASPFAYGIHSLKMPTWTRLNRAYFELEMGLRYRVFTYASASPVPEPTSVAGLAIGLIGVLGTIRARRRRANEAQ